jgi:hypothetical protein
VPDPVGQFIELIGHIGQSICEHRANKNPYKPWEDRNPWVNKKFYKGDSFRSTLAVLISIGVIVLWNWSCLSQLLN